jgi:hypothetical protein
MEYLEHPKKVDLGSTKLCFEMDMDYLRFSVVILITNYFLQQKKMKKKYMNKEEEKLGYQLFLVFL